MKLAIGLQLKPTERQAKLLLRTIEKSNQAANAVSTRAWENKTFQKFKLQQLVYHPTKDTFELTAQAVG